MDFQIWQVYFAYTVNQLDIELLAEKVPIPVYILNRLSTSSHWEKKRSATQACLTGKKKLIKECLAKNSDATIKELLGKNLDISLMVFDSSELNTQEKEQALPIIRTGLTLWLSPANNRNVKTKQDITSLMNEFDPSGELSKKIFRSASRIQSSREDIANQLFETSTTNNKKDILADVTRSQSKVYDLMASEVNRNLARLEGSANRILEIVLSLIEQVFAKINSGLLSPEEQFFEFKKIDALLSKYPSIAKNCYDISGMDGYVRYHKMMTRLNQTGHRVFTREQYQELQEYVDQASASKAQQALQDLQDQVDVEANS